MYYSPVRHSTLGLPPFRVRLAFVWHVSSVHFEPGSNSSVQSVSIAMRLLRPVQSLVSLQPRRSTTHSKSLQGFETCLTWCELGLLLRWLRLSLAGLPGHWRHPTPTPIGCSVFK